MEYKIICSGFGGQGVLFLGKVIAEAAICAGLEASWLPSYGPEMRGGTANCRVVISDSEIVSPAFSRADGLIAMNLSSLDKFKSVTDGIIVTDEAFGCDDTVGINTEPAGAGQMFDGLTNMIMLGTFVAKTNIFPYDLICEAIKKTAGGEKVDIDIDAFKYGYKNVE